MTKYYDGETVEKGGRKFRVNFEPDSEIDAPWERADGHGPVSDWTTRAKLPGERVLQEGRKSKRYYDFAEAMRMAKKDGWDREPFGVGTKGERALRAVESDFKYLQGWCNDRWYYIGVIVTDVTDDENAENDYFHAVWGIESNADEYLAETADEFIEQILSEQDEQRKQDIINCQNDLALLRASLTRLRLEHTKAIVPDVMHNERAAFIIRTYREHLRAQFSAKRDELETTQATLEALTVHVFEVTVSEIPTND